MADTTTVVGATAVVGAAAAATQMAVATIAVVVATAATMAAVTAVATEEIRPQPANPPHQYNGTKTGTIALPMAAMLTMPK